MAHGPCGPEFREAFSCFVYSEKDPKGIDCVEKFKAMQDCFRAHPDVYADGGFKLLDVFPFTEILVQNLWTRKKVQSRLRRCQRNRTQVPQNRCLRKASNSQLQLLKHNRISHCYTLYIHNHHSAFLYSQREGMESTTRAIWGIHHR